ncbi:hypothetical protein ASPWEDRAFT_456812 [Aspergillus wentii DTO 134E9]|uniref:Uncharacterized protein n=1 Tax=Aspergillus wentii DTO 134E9 TaxID=1073089 RepID=A0A1L9RRA3_ASPWE|nr:uncharacterized protein ASPWEDRAFT_456812 [Aspergillus wentii DTO 134E9]OJJ37496.1 hypothetical protein ASPWEDRAFT_456812 [Aspergillus wentii DTO 134E9]
MIPRNLRRQHQRITSIYTMYMEFPTCGICGQLLENELELMFTLRDRAEWKDKKTCSTTELEDAYFTVPWIWATFVRMILPTDRNYIYTAQNEAANNTFFLSGVGQMGLWRDEASTPIQVPLDQNVVNIGNHDDTDGEIISAYWTRMKYTAPNDQDLQYTPRGYVLHERCWWLAKRIIGGSILEKHLNLFAAALHDTQDGVDGMSLNMEWMIYMRAILDKGVERFLSTPQQYVQEYTGYYEHAATPIYPVGRDPVNIVELRDLVDKAKGRFGMALKPPIFSLPIDVQCLLADTLDSWDLSNTLFAFQWRLPDTYWRGRIPMEILFEYENIRHQNLDWQYFSLGLEKLFKTSDGLKNRQRILKQLGDIKKAFANKSNLD